MSWEIIIVENGSTDDTYIKSMKYAEKYSNINVFQSEKGVSKARNYGLKKAIGKWICFLDADDYIYPDAFNEIYKYIEDDYVKKIRKMLPCNRRDGNSSDGDTFQYKRQ